MDNIHMKFEDHQTMIQLNQKRIEEIFELIRGMDKRVLKITSNEQSINAKMVRWL
jgi:hypothetical protein